MESLRLNFRYREHLEHRLTLLKGALSGISSHSIFSLYIKSDWAEAADLASTIFRLTALREVDAILTAPQFRSLCKIRIEFWLCIQRDALKYPHIALEPSSSTLAPNPDSRNESASQSLLSEDPATLTSYRRKVRFEQHAVDLIELKIVEELKQLNTTGKLDLSVYVDVTRPQIRHQHRIPV